jgi:glutamyl-tRNA synthetase
MRRRAKAEKHAFRYPRPNPLPTVEQGRKARAEGGPVVIRLVMPERDITVIDDILGEVTLQRDQLEDFVIQKGDGFPTYHFACVVDDELMKVTHVLRGQEHLMNTPKHIALQEALGFATPRYAHLPVIFNMDGSKMSKRDKEKAIAQGLRPPEIEVHDFRRAGYLPEAIVNFIALLGWSAGDDREFFTGEELISSFRVDRVGKTNARFDREKLLSFNTTWATRVTEDRLLEAFRDYLSVNASPMRSTDEATLRRILKACAGFRIFRDVEEKTAFLFVSEDALSYDPQALKQVLAKNDGAGFAMLEDVQPALDALSEWTAAALERLLQKMCADRGVKLGQVAQPLRVAITGTTVSPPIYNSLELLGKPRTLSRIRGCLSAHRSPV